MRKGIIYVYFNRAKYEKEGIEKYYVGQTIGTMEQRAKKDGRGYCWANPNCNNKFANSIRKWGWDAFEGRVLEEVYEEDLNELEKFYIEYFDSFKNGYNTTLGGEGTRGHNPYANKTEEEMKEIKEKKSIGLKKRYEDPKARKKQSIAIKKYYEDPKARKKTSIAGKKRYEDPKEREKTSLANKKRFQDPKEREKISCEKNYKAKSIYCKELDIIFSYIALAEKYRKNVLNINICQVGRVCNSKRNFAGKLADGTKLTWNWLEDLDQETLDKAEYIDSKKYEEILSRNVNDCNK